MISFAVWLVFPSLTFNLRGSVRFRLVDSFSPRHGPVSDGANAIALCEAAMVLSAVFLAGARLRDRDAICFIDNSVSLFAFVKGGSNQQSVARSAHAEHRANFHTRTRTWNEVVDSKSNWSHSLSRNLDRCKFCAMHGIATLRVDL